MWPKSCLVAHFRAIFDVEAEIIVPNAGAPAIVEFPQRRKSTQAAVRVVRIEEHVDAAESVPRLVRNADADQTIVEVVVELDGADRRTKEEGVQGVLFVAHRTVVLVLQIA